MCQFPQVNLKLHAKCLCNGQACIHAVQLSQTCQSLQNGLVKICLVTTKCMLTSNQMHAYFVCHVAFPPT